MRFSIYFKCDYGSQQNIFMEHDLHLISIFNNNNKNIYWGPSHQTYACSEDLYLKG